MGSAQCAASLGCKCAAGSSCQCIAGAAAAAAPNQIAQIAREINVAGTVQDNRKALEGHLSQLVVVVRETQVDAACVDVYLAADQRARHRRALYVPACTQLCSALLAMR